MHQQWFQRAGQVPNRSARVKLVMILSAALVGLFVMGALAPAALANTITVAPGEVAIANNGVCSLREAINNANADQQVDNTDCFVGIGADTIELANSTYTLLNSVDNHKGRNGLPTITSQIAINGNGATIERDSSLTCNIDLMAGETGEFRIFNIGISIKTADFPGDLTLNDLTVQNGCADVESGGRDGGGVRVGASSKLMLNNSTIENNAANRSSGGIHNSGSSIVTIMNSTISMNSAQNGGAGIGNTKSSTMTIINSTISENSAANGGGIGNIGTMTIINSTISKNSADAVIGGGGGIGNWIGTVTIGTVTIVNSTISENSAGSDGGGIGNLGGGIGNLGGTVNIKNSIVANSPAGGDCVSVNYDDGVAVAVAMFKASGDNLDTDGSCANLDDDPDFPAFTTATATQLNLGPLADNGGPTQTHALLVGSEAIDAVRRLLH